MERAENLAGGAWKGAWQGTEERRRGRPKVESVGEREHQGGGGVAGAAASGSGRARERRGARVRVLKTRASRLL